MNRLEYVSVFCVVCAAEVPFERKRRRAVTCSEACARKRTDYLRERKELKKCKYCGNPSSPEERDDFRAWRRDRLAKKRAAAKAARLAAAGRSDKDNQR